MNIRKILAVWAIIAWAHPTFAQTEDTKADSLYIQEVQKSQNPPKVLHAEPLYIDLIRDLGARKGEKEWNIGLGLTDNQRFDSYEALIEYEWAPVDRLGFEVELPFTFYSPLRGTQREEVPSNRLEGLKLAAQWSFLVNERLATTMALGYINELELSEFRTFGKPLVTGNVYNPFLVIAKRWGQNIHSLLYTGPQIEQHFKTGHVHTTYDINTSFHYMISGTRNFMGVELNKTIDRHDFDMTIRPQMRLGISENLMAGIVVGIPVSRENQRFSSFIRLIWEPGH